MATTPKVTWQIYAIKGSASNIYLWQLINLITGNIHYYPVSNCTLDVELGSGTDTTSSDYSFVWNKYQLHELSINIIDVRYIGSGSGTPNYGDPNTDLAAILALI